jgi:hypothetical protein
MGLRMALWAGRQSRRLVHALRSKLWLLVPEDPGRERSVELGQLFDPSAGPAGAGRISVDAQRRIYLTRPTAVDPDTAAEAQAPVGLPVAYFVQVQGRAASLDMTGIEREPPADTQRGPCSVPPRLRMSMVPSPAAHAMADGADDIAGALQNLLAA